MGTRNLTVVVKDGEYKVAQYGQWDGYPTGQGATVVYFLMNEYDPEKFDQALKKIKYMKNTDTDFATNDRNIGAKILSYIQSESGPLELYLYTEFAGDSLMCEWAYVLNLDTQCLEVYTGFNKLPLKEGDRFFPTLRKEGHYRNEYHQVKLLQEFKFKELTASTMQNLEDMYYQIEEDL